MSRKLILASSIAIALTGTDVYALGLGGLHTHSALSQPFSGEIELEDARADELDSVKASLASQEAFGKAGIERYYYLSRLVFSPEVNAQGKPVIRVSSKDPIREPYMDFLVEVVWPSGQLIKEYTVLLDPPTLAKRSAPAVQSARAESARANRAAPPSEEGGSTRGSYISAPGNGFPIYAGPVRSGEGLWTLASEAAPTEATVAQTAMALYRNNQAAFIRGDINRLLPGRTLVIPSRAELFALDATEAQSEYAAALRGRARYRAPITEVTPEMLSSRLRVSGARTLSGDQEPPGGAAASSQETQPPSTSPRVQQDVMLALETSESTRQETVELRNRIRDLEAQLADIQSLLQLRNAELARLQGASDEVGVGVQSETREERTSPDASQEQMAPERSTSLDESTAMQRAQPGRSASGESSAETSAGSGASDSESSEAAKRALEAALAEEESSGGPSLIPVPNPVPAAGDEETTEIATETPVKPPKAEPKPQPKTEPPPAQEDTSTWSFLLLPLAGLAFVTALGITVFSWITMRRRREEEEAADEEILGDDEDRYDELDTSIGPSASIAAEKAATSVRLDKESGIEPLSSFDSQTDADSASSLEQFDAETDEADVFSEADIYIAYGRYKEAQDLLRAELKRSPRRLDVKYKLAEAFAAAGDAGALTSILDEIRSAGGDSQDPEQWSRLQAQLAQLRSDEGAAPTPGQELMPEEQDSMDLDSDDTFSLDISDAEEGPDARDSAPSLGNLELGKEETPEESAQPLEPPMLDLDLGSPEADRDILGAVERGAEAPGVGESGEQQGVAKDAGPEWKPREPGLIDLEDLDSVPGPNAIDEPKPERNEMEGDRPRDDDILLDGTSESSDSGLPPDQESVPSDLLSSQWQIDSGIWDETATKLDLARAYIEMDDKDAAREILEEVMSEGRDEQRAEARSMLDSLS